MIFWGLLVLEVVALALAARDLRRDTKSVTNYSKIMHDSEGTSLFADIRSDIRQAIRSPLMLVLAYAVVDHVALEALHRWLDGGPKPFTGIRAAGYHLSVAVVLGWPCALACAAWSVFLSRGIRLPSGRVGGEERGRVVLGKAVDGGAVRDEPRGDLAVGNVVGVLRDARRAVGHEGAELFERGHASAQSSRRAIEYLLGAWLIAAGGMAACYPMPRGWTAPILHACELAFVAAALAALPAGWRSRAITSREGQAIGLLVVVELVVAVLGAWGRGSEVFSREAWDTLSRVPYAIGWAVLCRVLARR